MELREQSSIRRGKVGYIASLMASVAFGEDDAQGVTNLTGTLEGEDGSSKSAFYRCLSL